MGKKILDSKVLYVVISVLLSFAAWLFVTSKDSTKDRATYRNLPITFEDVDILEERNLMIVSQDVRATITVRAKPMVLATLNSDPPRLVATVANITTEGPHTVNYTVQLPTGVRDSDVEISYGSLGGSAVSVEVARSLSRKVEIRGEFQGSAAEGYMPGERDEFRFSPSEVTITGRAELVNQVAYARVIVTEEELTQDVDGDFPFQLIGASGDPLEGLDVSCDVDAIYTKFPIRATAEIPLELRIIEGGGLGERDVRLTPSASSISVAGSREAVAALVGEGAMVFNIDLATVRDEDELTFPIGLPDELQNLSGVSELKVGVDVRKRVETRTFEVTSRISAINVPEGWRADIITQALQVEVRGTPALLDELTEENIQVVADLQDINQVAGHYTAPASVRLYSAGSEADVGVINPGSYSIAVSLSRDG